MTIPGYQTLMLPLLTYLSTHNECRLPEIEESLAKELKLSPEELLEMLPSGNQRIFKNRITWAITHLRKAGLVENRGRGIYVSTPAAVELLAQKPTRIDIAYLRKHYETFDSTAESESRAGTIPMLEESLDPVESLDKNYQAFKRALSEQLLETIKLSSPAFFERLVVDLLLAMGYGGSHQDILEAVKGRTGDEGIDGVIKEDPLGLDEIYIQAKRYSNSTIGRPLVQAFAGSMSGFHARKGVFITTTNFSHEAREYIQKIDKKIALIDGKDLISLMIDHNVGVSEKQTYTLKQIDLDYFENN